MNWRMSEQHSTDPVLNEIWARDLKIRELTDANAALCAQLDGIRRRLARSGLSATLCAAILGAAVEEG